MMDAEKTPDFRRSSSGFTLIELLVVVLIIGILAAIAVPQYFKVVEKGRISEAFSAFDSLRGAEERYLSSAGNYCTGAVAAWASNLATRPPMKRAARPEGPHAPSERAGGEAHPPRSSICSPC